MIYRLSISIILTCLIIAPLTLAQPSAPTSEQAETLVNEGDALVQNQNLQNALDIYKQAVSLYHDANDRQHEGTTLFKIGVIYYKLGEYAEALTNFEQAVALFQEIDNQLDREKTLRYIGVTYFLWNRYKEALEVLEEAKGIAEKVQDDEGIRISLKWIGDILLTRGRFREALETYRKISYLEERYRDRSVLMASQASVYMALGQYREAIKTYQQASDLLEKAGEQIKTDDKKGLIGDFLLCIGGTYLRIGDYDKALLMFQDALRRFRELQNKPREAMTLTGIGGIYEEQDQYLTAFALYEQALAIQNRIPDLTGKVMTLNNMAKAWVRLCQENGNDNLRDALDLYDEARKTAQVSGERVVEAKILNNMGEFYLHLSNNGSQSNALNQALSFFQDALYIEQETHDRANEWITRSNIGRVYELQGKAQEAIVWYRQAIDVLEEMTTLAQIEELTISLRAQAAETYQRLVLLLVQAGQPEQAFELSERARARAFLDQLGHTRSNIRSHATAAEMERESALRLELVELEREYRQEVQKSPTSQNPERLRLVEQQIEQKRLAYEEFLITLKAKNPEYASLVTVMPLSLKEVQKLLDQDTTLLAYVVASDKTIAFVITKRRFETVELPIGEDALMPAVVNVRKPAGAYDPIPEDLNKLYTRLITPLKPYLKTAKLGIIPHGVLHYLPFAALTDGKHYLSDEYILFFLPSVTVLKFIQEQRKFSDHTVLAMANGHAAGLPELIFAAEEVQAIATYSNTRLFISPKAATETAFKELASQFSILHLAAHAQLNLTNPLFSRILLTSDDQNDGALEVHEIYELDLHHAEMVVLSACETTLGKQSRGDDIIGLTRAFMYAGAPTVIASLWKVEDLATYEFMAAFYQQLRRGNSKADALRNAQKLTRKNYPHPYYWAAFMLTGDPGTMPE